MSYKEHMSLIGKEVYYQAKTNFWVSVKVQDLKEAYGRTLAKITPVDGMGELWIEVEKIGAKNITLDTKHIGDYVRGHLE